MAIFLDLQQQARELLLKGKYSQLASLYEQEIASEPEIITHYWYLGLAYLLQGQEETAQTTWLMAIAQGSEQETEQWIVELEQILDVEAQRQSEIKNFQLSWLIRQHIREVSPHNLKNLLQLILLAIEIENFSPEQLTEWQVAVLLQQAPSDTVELSLLMQVLKKSFEFPSAEVFILTEASIVHYKNNPKYFIDRMMPIAVKLAQQLQLPFFASALAELCLKLDSEHPEALRHLSCFYSKLGNHQKAIETAKHFFSNCTSVAWQIQASYLILRALFTAGSWLEIESITQRHKSLILDLLQNPEEMVHPQIGSHILTANFFFPYIEDKPQENRPLQNKISNLFQKNIQAANSKVMQLPWNNSLAANRKLKIGYIAHTLKAHSVGWLSRWLFQHSNKEAFQTNLYLLYQRIEDYQWFKGHVDCVHTFESETQAIVTQIKKDEIDILVDLDSLTLDTTSQVMALKPAPVQVTWLGWDASALPAIDYFIADPYVLPENAQDYYSETIWRLPHTYVAVDGFEVGVPTLRRENLNIPLDAIIYLSSQTGYKRHPDTVHLQMQILKQVPNSYFLIKGRADENTIRYFFTQIAEAEGVNPERLKFLPIDPSEFVHRANLSIADVVLDTYPYNGATTTLETLWMGVPIVTRVGQQFAARNSYTFMINVGVTEGIAWTDEEYVEWGVRLGKDPALRQQIAWKLRQSRQTSPLWNGKQFTQEMEKAYKQMWTKYIEAKVD